MRGSESPITVALVGCSKKKAVTESALPAKDLYTGRLCRLGYDYAVENGWDVHFLSALHGLVEPSSCIPPYDFSMAQIPKSRHLQWGKGVISKLMDLYPMSHLDIVFLTGKNYFAPVVAAAQEDAVQGYWSFKNPLDGLDLFGRMKWFKAQLPA